MTDQIRIKLNLDGVPQVQAGANAAAAALGKVDQAAAKVGTGGPGLAQIGAQLQDFIVQVQAGQSPLTALIQQGSQLSSMQGGLAGTFRTLASAISPTIALVGGAATAAGGLALAYAAGYRESKAFADGIALTGNAAGITEGRFNSLADSIGKRTLAGVSTAREALQTLVDSGKLTGEALSATASASAALARAQGESGADAAKKLLTATDDAAAGARRLNEQYNFLTAAQFANIKALDEAGNKTQAVAETMRLLEGRISTSVQNLSIWERGWNQVSAAIGGVWDKLKSIGRADTAEAALAAVNQQIERAERQAASPAFSSSPIVAQQLAALREQQLLLQQQVRLNREGAEFSAARAASEKAGIAWIDEGNKFLTRRQQMEREIKALRDSASAAGKPADDPELLRRIAVVTERYAEAKKKSADANTAERDAAKEWARVMEEAAKIQADAEGKTLDLTKAQAALVGYLSSPAYATNSEEMRQMAVAALIAANAAEEQGRAQKAAADAAAAALKVHQQLVADYVRAAESAENQAQRLEDEERAAVMAAEANITLAEAIARVTIERLKEHQAGLLGNPDAYLAAQREIDARERQLAALRTRGTREASAKAASEHQREWERVNEQVGQSLADALMEGGRSAADYIEGYFRSMVLRPVIQGVMQPVTSAVLGALGYQQPGGAQSPQYAQLVSAIGTAYNYGKAAYAAVFGGGATTAGAYASVLGGGAASGTGSQAAMLAAQTGEFGTTGLALTADAAGGTAASSFGGAAVSALGWAAFAYAAAQYGKKLYGEGFTGSKQLDGTNWYDHTFESYKTDALKGLGISDKWAEILGGSVRLNHMFGRAEPRIQGTGVLGTFSGGAFSGERYADVLEKGGLFKDDKRYTIAAELDSQIDRFFDDAAAAVVANAKKYGDALGLPASLMAGITQDVKVQLTGDVEKDKEAIAKALGEYGDALLAGFTEQVKPIAVYGETVAQTIERVGGALLTVNDALKQIGAAPLATSTVGGAAAVDLAARFGGNDQFASATSAFYSSYYSEAEQVQALTQRLSGTFADLGLTMPRLADGADAAKDAYRELVKGQDLNTEAGRSAFTMLIALSGAFDTVAQAAEKTAAAERERLAKIGDKSADLAIELLRAQGDAQGALNLQRARELQQLAELEVSLGAAAGTFTNAQRAINDAADAAERAAEAEAKRRSVIGGTDAVAADFLKGADLQGYLVARIRDQLGGAGFGDVPAANILGSTRADVLALWQAVGLDGKAAILEVLPLWEQLQESLHGTSNAIRDYRAGTLAEAIDEARLAGMTPEQRKAARETRSAQLFNDIATSDDPVAAAEKLRQLTMAGLQDEIQLREEANRKAIEGIDKQIDAAKRLQDLGANIGQFLGTLRFGDLSPLNARQQVGSARSLYERTLRDAQAGDVVAQGNLLGNAQAYLQEAQGTFGSGAGYVAVYEQVTRDLDAFGDKITAQRPELALLEAQRDSLASVATNTGDMLAALLRIDDALADRLDGGVGGSTLASAVRVEAANAPSFVEGNPGSPGGLSGGRDITGLVSGPDVVQTALVAFNTEQAVQSGLLRQTNQKLDAVHERLGAILQVGRAGHPDTVAIVAEAVSVLEDIRGRQARGQAPDTSSRKAA
jgi:hypothetical protein